MRRVVVLHEPEYSRNGAALLAPLRWCARRLARDHGIVLVETTSLDPRATSGDVLCVSAKRFKAQWAVDGGSRILAWLRDARVRAGRICWFDTSDGTGTAQFDVLPFVDRYVKNQVLRDRRSYQRAWYGSRIFTDYVHERFGVTDADPGEPHLGRAPPDVALAKIVPGWHYGFLHYGAWGDRLTTLGHRFPALPQWYPFRWGDVGAHRPMPVSCRMGIRYSRATVAYPRLEIRRRVAAIGVPIDRIPRRVFFRELRRARAGISPFGYGEICYRDFELMVAGAAMVKQDVSHLETWPDFWIANETYIPFAWDLSNFDAVVGWIQSSPREVTAIARAAQDQYRAALSPQGMHAFAERFAALVS